MIDGKKIHVTAKTVIDNEAIAGSAMDTTVTQLMANNVNSKTLRDIAFTE